MKPTTIVVQNSALCLLSISFVCAALVFSQKSYHGIMFDDPTVSTHESLGGPIIYSVLVFALTIIGIILGQVYTVLGPDRPDVPVGRELLNMLKSREFTRSVVASPVVFGAVYALALRSPDPITVMLFALENGFFCHSIVNQRRRQSEQQ